MQETKIASLKNELKVICWSNQFNSKTKPERLILFYEMKSIWNGFYCIEHFNLILINYLISDKESDARRDDSVIGKRVQGEILMQS